MNLFLLFITGAIAWRLYTTIAHLATVPKKVPWVGNTGSLVSYLFYQLKAIRGTTITISDAYHKYSKHGSICAIPLPFSRPEILIPRSLIRWMISQDESLLSPTPVQYEIVAVKYAFLNAEVHGDFAVYSVLRANMNRQLPKLVPIIMKELATRIDEQFGMSGEWREVPSHDFVRNVIARVSSRVIFGEPLCNDVQLLDNINNFSTCVVPSALLLRLFPPFMHPLLSYGTHSLNRVYKRRAAKVLAPYIREMIATMENDTKGDSKSTPRNDVLTWIVADAIKRNEARQGLVDRIICRIFVAVFASMETTTMTISHALLDICASPSPQDLWAGLAEEGSRVLSLPILDLASVNGLTRADSALKETLRLRTSIKALATEVTAPEGVLLEGYDVRLPQGSRLAVSAWGIHRDKETYGENADEYDAFRFSRPAEEVVVVKEKENGDASITVTANGTGNGQVTTVTAATPTTRTKTNGAAATTGAVKLDLMVTASENFLPFGLGRHSCPGRYFAAVELKLFLAYLAVHYDMQLADAGRPRFISIGHFPIPPLSGKLRLRRKCPALVSEAAWTAPVL